ncbi:M4 family metallopeptidase [Archangium primigenium]|uniref:M4 family metallopeptidase n=1 Tax=[Archangium] primigenium TaxID=2792470 RepID=UPI00195A1847|nr:M4 family metallopeptidase [Archangium primigenium]MBM7115942.1 M4 family metallopeptidase [Archangium primigenium]
MSRKLLASLTTLTLVGCGGAASNPVNSSTELDTFEGASMVAQAHQALRGKIQQGEEFVARGVIVDDNGDTHVRFDRTYQGLRVLGGDFVSHQDAQGSLRALSSASTESLAGLSVTPLLDPAAAADLAERVFQGVRNGAAASVELVIFAREGKPTPAFEVVLEGTKADGTPSALHVVVHALTGAVLETSDEIETAAANGTGNSLYVGAVSIAINSTSSGYELRDPSRGKGFYTLDMGGSQSGGGIFTSTTSSFGNGTSTSAASAGVDAHYGIQKTYDYFKNVHGRNGIDGAGGTGFNRVHYGSKYNNAFWTDSCFCMTYGDGDGTTFSPLTAIDVAGHEMTHGVTSRTARLVYSGESGGLNEATSDIFGSMVEFYAASASDPGDYLIGEKIYTPKTSGDALRYMANPSKDGKSANCWSSAVAGLDVHHSSGVGNHFFYLLAEGSSGSSTCNNTTLTGIGRSAAEKIWYRALTTYMTSSTKYAGARTATLSAAKDLFGDGSAQHKAVAAAWSGVSVN